MTKHVYICTPMYGGQCTGMYTQSMIRATSVMGAAGINMSFTCMLNESLIQRARNLLTHQFLKTDATHLMFIDADISFQPEDIPKMVDADVDIICGVYPKKEINWVGVSEAVKRGVPPEELKHYTGSLVVNLVDYASQVVVPINQPVEIWNGGTGFMLIKREVLEGLYDKVAHYTNDMNDVNLGPNNDRIAEFFPVFIDPDDNRLLSEDYAFCKTARKNGYKVYAAPWVKLGHYGTYLFEGSFLPAP